MIHYYHYYSKNDTNHLEKHKESIKSKILTDDMLTSGKVKKEKKRLSLLDTFFICLKKIFYFVCPSLKTMDGINNNDMNVIEKSKRSRMAVGEEDLNDTTTAVNKTMPHPTIVVDIGEEKLRKLKNEIIETFKDESKKMIREELKMLKDIIDGKVKVVEKELYNLDKNCKNVGKKKEEVVIDYTIVNNLIEKAIQKYDSDKTELVDYALESTGGRIVKASGDKGHLNTWSSIIEMLMIFQKPSPRIVIQRNSLNLIPGNAWCFEGDTGYIVIGLSYEIYITSVTYEHIHLENSPSGDLSSAPKDLEIFGTDESSYLCHNGTSIGNFTYKISEPSVQTFKIVEKSEKRYPMVKVRVKSNYGASYTCLYRIRVHGRQNFN
uniref:SUN domain-containing protein n=1 Tax=Strongyloides stercoralis TaxID=6248 RepID=A0A0K0EJ82_STRER